MDQEPTFQWPEGKRAAVSLSFDDARLTQADQGIPLLDGFGIKATFYVSPPNLVQRLDAWRAAARAGHEIGNHTLHHPCSANFPWSRAHALEDYTLDRMERELLDANTAIREHLAVEPVTFAYPCGQTFVGRGTAVQSYVPLIARLFAVGRGFMCESANDPLRCDLAQVFGIAFDQSPFAEVKTWLDAAAEHGGWLVFCGHEMGVDRRQGVSRAALDETCRYLTAADSPFWVDTVARIGGYVGQARDAAAWPRDAI